MKYTLILFLAGILSYGRVYSKDLVELRKLVNNNDKSYLEKLLKEEKSNYLRELNDDKKRLIKINIYFLKERMLSESSTSEILQKMKYINWILLNCKEDDYLARLTMYNVLSKYVTPVSYSYALKFINLSIIQGEKINYEHLPHLYDNKALLFFNNNNKKEAIKYFYIAYQKFNKQNLLYRSSMQLNMALSYRDLNDFDKFKWHLDQSYFIINKIKDPNEEENKFKHNILNSYGQYFSLIGKPDQAATYQLSALFFFRNDKRPDDEASIYSSQNKYAKDVINPILKSQLDNRVHLLLKEVSNENKIELIDYIIKYTTTNNFQIRQLTQKRDSISILIKNKAKSDINLISDVLINMIQNNETHAKQAEINRIEYNSRIKLTIVFIIIGFILIIGVIYFRNRLSNIRKNEIIKDQMLKTNVLEKELISSELKYNEKINQQLKINLILKNEAEQTFLEELKILKRKKNYTSEELISNLQVKILQLLEIDKRNNEQIQTKNNSFSSQLKVINSKFPSLTKLEQKLLQYFILNISTKEIATLLKMSEGSIRVYKNRIKKKIIQGDIKDFDQVLGILKN